MSNSAASEPDSGGNSASSSVKPSAGGGLTAETGTVNRAPHLRQTVAFPAVDAGAV
ncbi:MAG: hypothetical protein K8T25_10545 [Planctomycetia bacterium]|nr:hypothetical protein [Planctomycetia bacterium]